MLIKVISELTIVFCIVLTIMGLPSQTITKTVKEPVKETHCWCGKIPETHKYLNAKYHLSAYDIEQIDTKFYAPKMIEYQDTNPTILQWNNRFLIVAAYLFLIGIISAFVSSTSSNYWYYILPIIDTLTFIFQIPKNHKEKKIAAMININDRVSRILPNVISNLNEHLRRN